MERKMSKKLLEWKNDTEKTPLILYGARQVGKTYTILSFGKENYKNVAYINFEDNTEIAKIFEQDLEVERIIKELSVKLGINILEEDTLIFFDEIQACERALTSLKYFAESNKKYHVVAAGSLLGIAINRQKYSFPVGKVKMFTLYPLDFEEFALAMGEELLIEYIKECYNKKQPLDRSFHNRAMLVFQQYMLVGGMPMPVVLFIENKKNFTLADKEKRDILRLYREDIMKIDSRYRSKVLSIFDQMPGFLSQHEKRVVFKQIQEGSYADQYEDTFFWLSDSMISNECFLCSDPNVGLSLNEVRSYVKCYLGDTGLLVSHAFDENELLEDEVYKQILAGKLQINEGMLYENVIAQMLVANGHKLYFYTHYNSEKHRNDIEIDFLISNNSKLKYKMYPIEVKSGKQYTVTSLTRFREKYKKRIGECYIIHPKNLCVKEDIVCIPPYMTFLL